MLANHDARVASRDQGRAEYVGHPVFPLRGDSVHVRSFRSSRFHADDREAAL